jgi:hypothetical protein
VTVIRVTSGGRTEERTERRDAGGNVVERTASGLRQTFKFDGRGQVVETAWFRDAQPAAGPDGWHSERTRYDHRGFPLAVMTFGPAGEPAPGADGCFRRTSAYTARGYRAAVVCQGPDGAPAAFRAAALGAPGFSRVSCAWNSRDLLASASLAGEGGTAATARFTYDGQGRPAGQSSSGGLSPAALDWLRKTCEAD